MNFIKTYPAHQNRVSAIVFSLAAEWVVSTGHDKCVSWMCTRSGNMLGRHFFSSWASCLQYPSKCQTFLPTLSYFAARLGMELLVVLKTE
ncbi:rCG23871 [Rattus norvegicus]|uniref:RCG23871 n=1 Tax=Rattus norvegicus TaxID=10116 RepID=A6JW78_RAT|nr:rCG23871 [Rattus norvegicus]